jgi:hypothetical protein
VLSGRLSRVDSFREPLWACATGFPPIAIEAEHWLAEGIGLNCEFCSCADGAVERPVARAGGPYGDDRRVWICAFFAPVASLIEEGGVVMRTLWPSLEEAVT